MCQNKENIQLFAGLQPGSILSGKAEIAQTQLLLHGCTWNCTWIHKPPNYKADIPKIEEIESTAVRIMKL